MNDYDDSRELAAYVWSNYAQYLTPLESRVGLAVTAEQKAAAGHAEAAEFIRKRDNLSPR
jgi:hypothetical protein